ncbi:MAG: triose-phosphate isomerase [Deltaproteobacteria bacterium]|nr:triose-phosphate isomerase [Deltaproteobacteria bacterium]
MTDKKIIIAANFKMNKTHIEVRAYLNSFFKKLKELNININDKTDEKCIETDAEIIFAPPFTALNEAYNIIEENIEFRHLVKLASQNIYFESAGAYTGEISIEMIKAFDCSYAIIGHSERRWILNESDDLIAKKIFAVFNYSKKIDLNLIPILCVGENLDIRKSGKAFDFVAEQLDRALSYSKNNLNSNMQNIDDKLMDKNIIEIDELIVAYEPIWAIGTGAPIEPEDGEKMHKFIYKHLNNNYSIKNFSVIYGGSVTEKNINTLMKKEHIDGVLVGGASLDPQSFFNIYKFAVSK